MYIKNIPLPFLIHTTTPTPTTNTRLSQRSASTPARKVVVIEGTEFVIDPRYEVTRCVLICVCVGCTGDIGVISPPLHPSVGRSINRAATHPTHQHTQHHTQAARQRRVRGGGGGEGHGERQGCSHQEVLQHLPVPLGRQEDRAGGTYIWKGVWDISGGVVWWVCLLIFWGGKGMGFFDVIFKCAGRLISKGRLSSPPTDRPTAPSIHPLHPPRTNNNENNRCGCCGRWTTPTSPRSSPSSPRSR